MSTFIPVGNITGPQGPIGPAGTNGIDGAPGATGAPGAAGVRGSKWFVYAGTSDQAIASDPAYFSTALPGDIFLDSLHGLLYFISA